jgi:hypothetical protein
VSFAIITLWVASQRVFVFGSIGYRLSPATFGYTLVGCLYIFVCPLAAILRLLRTPTAKFVELVFHFEVEILIRIIGLCVSLCHKVGSYKVRCVKSGQKITMIKSN